MVAQHKTIPFEKKINSIFGILIHTTFMENIFQILFYHGCLFLQTVKFSPPGNCHPFPTWEGASNSGIILTPVI